MIRISVDMTKVNEAVYKRQNRLKLKNTFMATKVKPIIKREVAKNFLGEGRPAAGRNKWEELSAWRQKERASEGYPPKKPILIASGNHYRHAVQNLRLTFRGNRAYFSIGGTSKEATVLKALHYGVPAAKIDAFGRGNNKGKVTTRTHPKSGKPFVYRLPSRPILFVSKKGWKDIQRAGLYYFYYP